MPKCVNLLVNTTLKESQYWFKKNLFQLQGQWLVISGCMHFLPQVCGALFDTINMFEDKISMYKIDSQHFGFRDQGSSSLRTWLIQLNCQYCEHTIYLAGAVGRMDFDPDCTTVYMMRV